MREEELADAALWLIIPAAQSASGQWIDDTLKERIRECGLGAKVDLAGSFPRQRVEVIRGDDPVAVVNDVYYRRGWTDGLPIVPPTTGAVEAMLQYAGHPPTTVIAELDPLKGVATAERVAANAVMAGCRAEYFPVVVAAVQAIAEPAFNLRGVQTTDENVTPLLILNGPLAQRLEVNARFGALGPGWRANATIGRALRLVMNNIGGGWPAAVSFAGLGQPGRYSLCLAEDEERNPWEPLHVEAGFAAQSSTLTVMRAESCINVTGGLVEIASVMGSAASLFGMLYSGKAAIVLAPATAAKLAREGWSKDDVKSFLFERGRMEAATWRQSWAFQAVPQDKWPDWVWRAAESGAIPAVRAPDDITVVVAGGDVPIAQHAYFPSWGFPACRITKAIEIL